MRLTSLWEHVLSIVLFLSSPVILMFLYHQLYFDNFFTSYHLMTKLAEKSMRATETKRENRTEEANKQLIQNKELQGGTYDYCSDGKVYIAKCHDNSVVNIASN